MRHTSRLMLAAAMTALLTSPALAERGADGELRIIYWQAPSTQNPYLSGGTKEVESASLVIEPLAGFDETGNLFPRLVEGIPTVENGGVAADLKSITWVLKEGLVWSDGTPVTSADAVFTWQYCTHPEGGCAQSSYFEGVSAVEAVDDRTIKISFDEPKPFPYTALVGAESPLIQKAQFEACMGAKAPECTAENFGPIGTGPFKVSEFRPNDVVTYEANENYRDAAKPAFSRVLFKGGGEAASAARSVLETGEFDYAWNLQVEPEILSQMEAAGKGKVVVAFGTSVERIWMNQTNADASLPPEKRSVYMDGENKHPFLTDPAVVKAMSMAIDRQLLVDVGYGAGGKATCNLLPAPEIYASTANDSCLTQDIEGAKKVLDDAGWVPGSGGVREKDGVRLSVLYQTSTNSVRQGAQALIKQWWDQLGIETELRNVDASVFFGGDPGSPDTFQKFYSDVEMFTNNFSGVDPEAYMANWRCADIPGPNNQWQGANIPRYCNADYDALVAKMAVTAKLEERAELAKQMNDMLVQSSVVIPLIHRGGVSAHANTLGGVKMSDWDSELWNIADWHRVK